MAHTIRNKAKLLARTRRLKGQVDGIERALRAEVDCGEVLQQIAAIRGAANSLMGELLEGHVQEHLAGVRSRDTRALLAVIRRYLK
jgi:DNA-binding FrmR family transcriptional regulator